MMELMDRKTMDFQKSAQNNPSPRGTRPDVRRKPKSFSLRGALLPFIVLLLIIVGGFIGLKLLSGSKMPDSDKYQAVFLDNGQVFFGKLKNIDGKYLYLEKAYYTKSQELPEDATDQQKAATENNVSLVKVGDEVYGPENNMSIRAEQVLFWQDLSEDSKVAQAIDQNS
jgi:hypothetical protein